VDISHWSYSEDIEHREAMLQAVASSDYPLIAENLGRLLETGGPLAFRDYLLYLGRVAPQRRDRYWQMPLSLGRQYQVTVKFVGGGKQELASAHDRPRPSLSKVISTAPLERMGLLSQEKEYGYGELAQVVERTLHDWRTPSDPRWYYIASDVADGPIFTMSGGGVPSIEAHPTIPGSKATGEIGKESANGMEGWGASEDTHSIPGGRE
jgi:hypothetical protein